MDDLVKRLRSRPRKDAPRWAMDCFEAADEIERLRKICNQHGQGGLRHEIERLRKERDDAVDQLQSAIRLSGEIDDFRKDALRYRFIRGTEMLSGDLEHLIAVNANEDLDEAIDAALAKV